MVLGGGRSLWSHGWGWRCRSDLQGFSFEAELLSTLGTVASVTLNCLAGGLQFDARVESFATLGAQYSLR